MISRRKDIRRGRDGSARKSASGGSEVTVKAQRTGSRTEQRSVLGSDMIITSRYPVIVPESSGNYNRLSKLLINVTIQRSLGPVQVVMSSESTVEDLMKAVIGVYVKEKRRPLLNASDPTCFELHYSQFSLESLDTNEKLKETRSRNFFLCMKPTYNVINSSAGNHRQQKKLARWPSSLTDLMDLLL